MAALRLSPFAPLAAVNYGAGMLRVRRRDVLVTLPASAVRSGQTVVASPVFEIRPATPVAVIDAPDFEYEDEFGDTVPKDENVISGTGLTDGPTFTISLSGDTWVAAVGNDTYAGYATTTAALLASLHARTPLRGNPPATRCAASRPTSSQRASGGIDIRIDSVRPPVCNPNKVPRSNTRLNST